MTWSSLHCKKKYARVSSVFFCGQARGDRFKGITVYGITNNLSKSWNSQFIETSTETEKKTDTRHYVRLCVRACDWIVCERSHNTKDTFCVTQISTLFADLFPPGWFIVFLMHGTPAGMSNCLGKGLVGNKESRSSFGPERGGETWCYFKLNTLALTGYKIYSTQWMTIFSNYTVSLYFNHGITAAFDAFWLTDCKHVSKHTYTHTHIVRTHSTPNHNQFDVCTRYAKPKLERIAR